MIWSIRPLTPQTSVNNDILYVSLIWSLHLLLLLFLCFSLYSFNCWCCCCCYCCCCHLESLEVTGAPMEAAHPCPHSPCWRGLQPYTSLHIASTLQSEDSWASFIFRIPWNQEKTLTMLDGSPTLHIFTHGIKNISVHLFTLWKVS